MKIDRLPPVVSSLRPSPHPYLNGAWTPQHEEVTVARLDVIEGTIPGDLDGVYLRNTENQLHQPLGRYHPFDGDGMIHQIDFHNRTAAYRNRFVRTRCFEAEQSAGASLWGGIMDGPGVSRRPGFGAHGGIKDSSSTDVIVHAGKAISTFYQCGEAYLLDPETLEQFGVAPWAPLDGVSAHPKVDGHTGELLFFNYSTHAPYMHYGVVNSDGRLIHYVPIRVPGPRLPHDMVFSEHWSVLCDLPLFWDETLLAQNIHRPLMHDLPARFALIPRHGKSADTRWFEASPTYVLHFLNAFEQGSTVVVDGYFQENPSPAPLPNRAALGQMMAFLDEHSFRPILHRWEFDLDTGACRETRLDSRVVEFGTINQRFAGRPYRYAYSSTAKPGWFLFNGFIKHDLLSGESIEIKLDEGRFASEAPFAPRVGAIDEDDGYLVSFVTDENTSTSECVVIDCREFAAGPVCRIALPHKISSGTHAHWAERSSLRASSAAMT